MSRFSLGSTQSSTGDLWLALVQADDAGPLARHRFQGLEIVGLSDDPQNADRFPTFISKQGLTWPQVLVDRWDDPRIAAFHVPEVP